jgi:hypothetical protein
LQTGLQPGRVAAAGKKIAAGRAHSVDFFTFTSKPMCFCKVYTPSQQHVFMEKSMIYPFNNFREMTSVDYKKGDDYITIQAYRHATPEDAFGMYASERSAELTYLPRVGGEAQGDDENLFFFAGTIYVKTSSHSETEVKHKCISPQATSDTTSSAPPIRRSTRRRAKPSNYS